MGKKYIVTWTFVIDKDGERYIETAFTAFNNLICAKELYDTLVDSGNVIDEFLAEVLEG